MIANIEEDLYEEKNCISINDDDNGNRNDWLW